MPPPNQSLSLGLFAFQPWRQPHHQRYGQRLSEARSDVLITIGLSVTRCPCFHGVSRNVPNRSILPYQSELVNAFLTLSTFFFSFIPSYRPMPMSHAPLTHEMPVITWDMGTWLSS